MTTIHVTASREYDVLVQPGLLDDAGAQIAQVLGTGRTAAVVAGETVAGLYAAHSPYLNWNYHDPETAVAGAVLHGFEWLFVYAAPLVLIGGSVGLLLTRKKK